MITYIFLMGFYYQINFKGCKEDKHFFSELKIYLIIIVSKIIL